MVTKVAMVSVKTTMRRCGLSRLRIRLEMTLAHSSTNPTAPAMVMAALRLLVTARVGDEEFFIPENPEAPIETGKHRIGPHLEEARNRLLAEGMTPDRITIKIHAVDRDRPPRIVQEAMENNFGSIVVGRRGMITFFDAYFIGRVSDQVLKLADQLAVWII